MRIKGDSFYFCISILFLPAYLVKASKFEDQKYWFTVSNNELNERLNTKLNHGVAKNLVIFVGDGMSVTTVTASRIYAKGESGHLSWEKFPFSGIVKTYNTDKMVPDSASTATAIFTGVKTNQRSIGLDVTVKNKDCEASLNDDVRLKGLMSWALDAGKSTGIVTTTRVVHATPSALYAHSADRHWECEDKMPIKYRLKCKDIGRQMVEDYPGRFINVILGGGRQCLVSNSTGTSKDPIDTWACYRRDGRNLIETWKKDKTKRGLPNAFVKNTKELKDIDYNKTEYLLGVFSNGHMPYDDIRDTSPEGVPSLKEMVTAALKILRKNNKGFVLMVEGGLIDVSHHFNFGRRSLRETEKLSETVEYVSNLFGSDTLLVVTADHAHSLVLVGYPERGKGVLGLSGVSPIDSVPYTTLAYGTGYKPTGNFTVWENGSIHREDPSKLEITSYNYHQQSAIILDEATHDGSDVFVYAKGPWSHLFSSLHEQTFLAHAMAYSLRIGPYASRPLHSESSESATSTINPSILFLVLCLGLAKYIL